MRFPEFTKRFLPWIILLGCGAFLYQGVYGDSSKQANAPVAPGISEIVRIDPSNVFFLDSVGRIGVARFAEDLTLKAWDYYSEFQWSEARHLAVGRNLSVVSGSQNELTQAFDTDKDGKLDFFQDTIKQWPGKTEGATISCGPITDLHGRLLFAVAPKPRDPDDEKPEKIAPSTLFAWNPGGEELTTLATSSLPISEMAVSQEGRLVAWIQLPSYTEGYYLAVAELPPFDPRNPDKQPESPVSLMPNLIIPAELTDFKPIGQFCITRENDVEKIFVACPMSKRLVELIPELHPGGWGGLISVREQFEKPIYAVEPMAEGRVLLGGEAGFHALDPDRDSFHYRSVRMASDAFEIDFSRPVDRSKAVSQEEGIQLAVIPLEGKLDPFDPPQSLVESDGLTVVVPLPDLPPKAIIKIDAPSLTCENGESLLFPSIYYIRK